MGDLYHFHLPDAFVDRFPVFIETGYGDGKGLDYAATHHFKRLYSIEIWPEAAERGRRRFENDPRVMIVEGNSLWQLDKIIDHETDPCFIWLDAHFPGADHDGQPYDGKWMAHTRTPLPYELDMIANLGGCFVLADDLKLYTRIRCEDKCIPNAVKKAMPPRRSLMHLFQWFDPRLWEIRIDHHDGGYAMIGPKGCKWIGEYVPC
jgi:hypothetical protein